MKTAEFAQKNASKAPQLPKRAESGQNPFSNPAKSACRQADFRWNLPQTTPTNPAKSACKQADFGWSLPKANSKLSANGGQHNRQQATGNRQQAIMPI